MRPRRVVRRTARRTTRRTVRRMRRRRRRRLILGGFTVLAIGGAAYGGFKLATRDVQNIEQHTGRSADDLTEQELISAMEDLGIQKIELTDADKAEVTRAESAA
jgi:cell division septal protein FtsQ